MGKDTLIQTLFMVVGYLIAWTPYSIAAFATATHPTFPYNPKFYITVVLIAKTSYVYNAFIYIFANNKVKLSIFLNIFSGTMELYDLFLFSLGLPSGPSSVSCRGARQKSEK